jgi:GTP pyrophosphokinase
MHHIAEYGLAAHWVYKQSGEFAAARSYPWVAALIDILETEPEAADAMESTKLELHRDMVFCFSPKGDLIELPQGSTPVDFAYHVHSQVGDACVGAKVNGRIVRLHDKLGNGDQVEIITAKGGKPNPAWMKFVASGKAQARIRRFAVAEEKARARDEGRTAIVKAFRQNGLDFQEKLLEPAAKALRQHGVEELFHAVASGSLSARDVVHAAFPELRGPPRAMDTTALVSPRGRLGKSGQTSVPSAPITGVVAGMQLHFAHCCHPIPATASWASSPPARASPSTPTTATCWRTSPPRPSASSTWNGTRAGWAPLPTPCASPVAAMNGPSLLSGVANAISKQKGVLTNLRLGAARTTSATSTLDVEVRNTRHLRS